MSSLVGEAMPPEDRLAERPHEGGRRRSSPRPESHEEEREVIVPIFGGKKKKERASGVWRNSDAAAKERLTPEPIEVDEAQRSYSSSRSSEIARDLREVVRDSQIVEAPGELQTFAYDASFETQLRPRLPEAAVIAGSEEDVVAVMKYAHEHSIPVTTRG
ncbi:MAG: FAD-binding oxidoreductase, partial [Rubrobacter sp.]|nr:FAD-binding oxidoreductase [Rubrobacter sp.]